MPRGWAEDREASIPLIWTHLDSAIDVNTISKYVLGITYMLGIVLDAQNAAVNGSGKKVPCPSAWEKWENHKFSYGLFFFFHRQFIFYLFIMASFPYKHTKNIMEKISPKN